MLLDEHQAAAERAAFSCDLYAILVSLLESTNRRLEPPPNTTIIELDVGLGFARTLCRCGRRRMQATRFELLRGVPLSGIAIILSKKPEDGEACGILTSLGSRLYLARAEDGKNGVCDRKEELPVASPPTETKFYRAFCGDAV
jgi:hypothetical protein